MKRTLLFQNEINTYRVEGHEIFFDGVFLSLNLHAFAQYLLNCRNKIGSGN